MIMPASRNFRKVLGVDPDSSNPHCVGVRKDGGQCGLPMSNMSDRPRASALLTKMDTQALTDSYRDLEELAFLTLCSRWHRKPSHSQVGQVATRWRQKIQQFEREEEEIAMMARSRPALARKEATAEIMKVTVKNGRNEMVICVSLDFICLPTSNFLVFRYLLRDNTHRRTARPEQ